MASATQKLLAAGGVITRHDVYGRGIDVPGLLHGWAFYQIEKGRFRMYACDDEERKLLAEYLK